MFDSVRRPSEINDKPPQTFERRAFVRYPRTLETLWQFLGLNGDEPLTSGQIFDLSATGVGLIMDRPFKPNTSLVLRLQSATMGWNTFLVRIRRCTQTGPTTYQVGCTFVKPLTLQQMQDHLT